MPGRSLQEPAAEDLLLPMTVSILESTFPEVQASSVKAGITDRSRTWRFPVLSVLRLLCCDAGVVPASSGWVLRDVWGRLLAGRSIHHPASRCQDVRT